MSRSLPYIAPTGSERSAEYHALLALQRQAAEATAEAEDVTALTHAAYEERSTNPLRPHTLGEIVGQAQAKEFVAAALKRARVHNEPLAHMLLVGPAGTGKSTLAHVVATELGTHVYQLAAPVSHATLLELRTIMRDRDVLFIDELHQQAAQERRGRESATSPEVLFGVMEDRVIATATGVLPFPAITLIGGTTDEGQLSDAFLSRFPLRPRLVEYTLDDLAEIARRNAHALGATLDGADAARLLAVASRGVPREVNNLVRNAQLFSKRITLSTVREVLRVNGIEEQDGLTPDQAAMLKFIALCGRRQAKDGTVRFIASVNTICTGIGKSRDTKAVVLRIEPYLIRRGYISISHSGRELTGPGAARAAELLNPEPTPHTTIETPAARAMRSLGL